MPDWAWLVLLLLVGDLLILRPWLAERRAHAKSRQALAWWRKRAQTGKAPRGHGEAA